MPTSHRQVRLNHLENNNRAFSPENRAKLCHNKYDGNVQAAGPTGVAAGLCAARERGAMRRTRSSGVLVDHGPGRERATRSVTCRARLAGRDRREALQALRTRGRVRRRRRSRSRLPAREGTSRLSGKHSALRAAAIPRGAALGSPLSPSGRSRRETAGRWSQSHHNRYPLLHISLMNFLLSVPFQTFPKCSHAFLTFQQVLKDFQKYSRNKDRKALCILYRKWKSILPNSLSRSEK